VSNVVSSTLPRPGIPKLPALSPGSSVGQFNTQRQGALLQGHATPNPTMSVGSVQTRISRPVTNLALGDSKVSKALDMRRQTLSNMTTHVTAQTKKNQALTAVKRAQMRKMQAEQTAAGGGTNTFIGHGGRGMVNIGGGKMLRADTASAFAQLNAAFRAAGMGVLGVNSGYRSIEEQTRLYNGWKAGLPGYNKAAPPGHSNHNHGTAVDLSGYGGSTNSPQFRWLLQNAGRFGFSWDEGRAAGEPWHWVYVGG